ncbi:hypothetical protein K1719_047323 [Acacia pycnantha]|nr:hypothetical protein K1719_047323 [Acacia pycnantha]
MRTPFLGFLTPATTTSPSVHSHTGDQRFRPSSTRSLFKLVIDSFKRWGRHSAVGCLMNVLCSVSNSSRRIHDERLDDEDKLLRILTVRDKGADPASVTGVRLDLRLLEFYSGLRELAVIVVAVLDHFLSLNPQHFLFSIHSCFLDVFVMVGLQNPTRLILSICAIVVKGHWSNLLTLEKASALTSSTVHQVLLQLYLHGFAPSHSFSFFKWVETIPNYRHSLQCSWSMLHILVKGKHFRTAQEMLEKISHRDFLSSPSVLRTLIEIQHDPEVNAHILSWLVIHYAKSKMTDDAIQDGVTNKVWKVYKQMVKVGVFPNMHIYNVLVHACSKSGDVERAENILNEMEVKGVYPDIFTYNTLISLYCKRSMHYEALCIQERMEREGINLDIVSYNSLIYGFCREGRMREAMRIFSNIKGAIPNTVTYTTLIDGYCKSNDLEQALKMREAMQAEGLYPGVVTCNTILRKLCQDGKIREANKLLIEMSERKIQPDNVTCNTLINAYCKIGDMKSALKFKNKMLEGGLKPDPFTYKALIHGFCKIKELERAKEMLFSMLDAGFAPNYYTYSWIVDGYCNKGNEDALVTLLMSFLEELFNLMEGRGILGDSVVYTSLAYAYWKLGNAKLASNILEDMTRRRLMITSKIYKCFGSSLGSENHTSCSFWNYVVERGLMSRNTMNKIKQMEL